MLVSGFGHAQRPGTRTRSLGTRLRSLGQPCPFVSPEGTSPLYSLHSAVSTHPFFSHVLTEPTKKVLREKTGASENDNFTLTSSKTFTLVLFQMNYFTHEKILNLHLPKKVSSHTHGNTLPTYWTPLGPGGCICFCGQFWSQNKGPL